ncbi:MAG: ABC transporter ATP-binding protein [Bauldia sp.]|nr:ABC transporter ATP-binding protein [Bauldia sp.]
MHHPVDRSQVQAKTNNLVVRGLTHYYGSAPAVEDVSFEIAAGEIVALLGPSGCGKTTVLRAIAGLLPVRPGMILLAETDLAPIPGRARGFGMVFQNYALFPHMTVAENIGYALSCRGWPRERKRARVAELVATVQLEGLERRLPRELSGGQQQRVAVARAIAVDPALLLLDEPFAALDRALRIDLQVELARLQRSLGITTLIVTHDQEEAQSLADRIVVMNRGRVEQIGSPSEVYDKPASLFVNGFMGYASRIRATVEAITATETTLLVSTGETLTLPRPLSMRKGSRVVLTTRPEGVALGREPSPGGLKAEVLMSIPHGPNVIHSLTLQDGTEIKATEPRHGSVVDPADPGSVFATPDTKRLHVFPEEDVQPDFKANPET